MTKKTTKSQARIPFFVKRFVSGPRAEDAVTAAQKLKADHITSTIDLLGENVADETFTRAAAQEYKAILGLLQSAGLEPYISIKLTMLGLDLDEELCWENLHSVLQAADECQGRVCLDMEGSAYTERTLRFYERACTEHQSPEIVLQAYLHRTPEDVERVLACNGRLRLCKGAYGEPESLAIKSMTDIRTQYLSLSRTLLQRAQRVCLATHDDLLIKACEDEIRSQNVPKSRYEFQMLYGLRPRTWRKLQSRGHNMTVYVPYGESWQAYYSRRLTERKENVFFILRNFFKP